MIDKTEPVRFLSLFLLVAAFTAQAKPAEASGVWTSYTHANPGGESGTMLLLTDGTLMVLSGASGPDGQSAAWNRLTPDSTGSYAKGTWSTLASMKTARLYFGSNVMPNGKVFVIGGEYSGTATQATLTNTGAIYDPIANKWTAIPNFPRPQFGDDPTILLPNGKILCGYIFDGSTYLFDPASNSWSQTGTKLRGDRSDEETWIILPDGSVLSYDIFASDSNQKGSAQRYDSLTNKWVDAGTVPVLLSGSVQGDELGPAMLLPDGRVIQIGANEHTAIYTPSTNTWLAGPSLPSGMGADDAPGAMLPNGHFVFLADSYLFNGPTKLFDFYYATNTLTDITSTLPSGLISDLASGPAFYRRMMVLPDGHLVLNTGSSLFWDFAPSGSPQANWAPTITEITQGTGANSNGFTLMGNQLTGISQGASYGDDVESDTNYPIVSLVGPSPATTVQYARSSNWIPGVSSPGTTAQTTVDFVLPSGIGNGTYQLSVIANGIRSTSVSFTIPFSNVNYVSATYNVHQNLLSLSDDAGDNSVAVTLKNGKLTVKGQGNTLIGDANKSVKTKVFTISTSNVNVDAEFTSGGNNTFTMTGILCPKMYMAFGKGNDTANMHFSNITNLSADGGAGTNSLFLFGTKVKNKSIVHMTVVP